jgi:transposase
MNRYPDTNSVLVCDNASYHRGERVQQLCDAVGVRLMYLPPYCPELNPIELGFAAIKQRIRSSQILDRTDDPEWEIRRVTAEILQDNFCYKIYKHCGYCVPPN